MKIKKIIASSMPEAMKKIKEELGKDAIILASKEVKPPGLLRLFRKKRIEVTAAIDTNPITKAKGRQINRIQDEQPIINQNPTVKEKRTNQIESETSYIMEEIKHLQQLLETNAFDSKHNLPPVLERIYQYLLSQEVTEELAMDFTQQVQTIPNIDEYNDRELIKSLQQIMNDRLSKVSFNPRSSKGKVLQFVGPTGVGKTTTIAKIAANTLLKDKKTVAFITADTYRIAAVEQLKTYAKILDVPLEVVYTVEDYQQALQKLSSYDYIFVDTAGRNYREERYIKDLQQYISSTNFPHQLFLVLSLTAKAEDITYIYECFKPLHIKHLIFTKVDETETFGSLLNVPLTNEVGIAYLTNGQDVPDDLLTPTPETITEMILSRYYND